jgi:Zn-dependent protease
MELSWIFIFIILIFSAILHEYMHGFTAYLLGDSTAKNMGRLTFNPIPHIDPFYTIILPIIMIILPTNFIIGGAKPVPINPFNLKGKYAQMKVALAGPLSNLLLATVFGLLIRFIPLIKENEPLFFAFSAVVFVNLLLAVFNLLPIPPLDGSHVLFTFFPSFAQKMKLFFSQYGFIILIGALFLFANYIFYVIFLIIAIIFYPLTGTSLVEFLSLFSQL